MSAESLPTAFFHLTVTQYAQSMATALIGWDYFLTVDSEVKYFWCKGWTWSKALFLISRYFSIFAAIVNTLVLFHPDLTAKLYVVSGHTWHHFILDITCILEAFIVQGIFVTRLHVMYCDNRRIFHCVLAWYFSSMTVALIGLGFVTVHAPNPYQPMAYPNMCFPQPVGRYVWLMWTPVLSFEIVAFVLAVRQTQIYVYQAPFRGRTFIMELFQIVLRDSTRYFVLVCIVFTTHGVIFEFLPPALERLLQGVSTSVISVVGTRMMINLKDNAANARTRLYLNTLPYSSPPK